MSTTATGAAPTLPKTRVGALAALALPRVGPPPPVWPDRVWDFGQAYDRIASGSTQFLSRDPMTLLTREPYTYVAGNPVNAVDPTGLCLGWIWGADDCQAAPCLRNPFGGDNDNGGCHTEIGSNTASTTINWLAQVAITIDSLGGSKEHFDGAGFAEDAESAESSCPNVRVETRAEPGLDGGVSSHVIASDDAGTVSVTHVVRVDGEIVHRHTTYIGKYGGRRPADTFPPEWTHQ